MDIRELYSGLRRIQNRGETGNAYSGCGTVDEDRDVLGNFFDYVVEKYEDSMHLGRSIYAGFQLAVYRLCTREQRFITAMSMEIPTT